MITPAKARELASKESFYSFEKELQRISDEIEEKATHKHLFATVYEIPYEICKELKEYLVDLGYKVSILRDYGGRTVQFVIRWG